MSFYDHDPKRHAMWERRLAIAQAHVVGRSKGDIGKEFGISRERVRQIISLTYCFLRRLEQADALPQEHLSLFTKLKEMHDPEQ